MNDRQTTRLFAGIALAALAATVGHAAYAQGEYIAVSRAEVKAQTRAANQAGMLFEGEADPSTRQPAPLSTRSRAERKAETAAANVDGGFASGKRSYVAHNVAPREALAKSTKTRADGKAETMQAIRDHGMIAAGEASI